MIVRGAERRAPGGGDVGGRGRGLLKQGLFATCFESCLQDSLDLGKMLWLDGWSMHACGRAAASPLGRPPPQGRRAAADTLRAFSQTKLMVGCAAARPPVAAPLTGAGVVGTSAVRHAHGGRAVIAGLHQQAAPGACACHCWQGGAKHKEGRQGPASWLALHLHCSGGEG